jgi:hypothetical protein
MLLLFYLFARVCRMFCWSVGYTLLWTATHSTKGYNQYINKTYTRHMHTNKVTLSWESKNNPKQNILEAFYIKWKAEQNDNRVEGSFNTISFTPMLVTLHVEAVQMFWHTLQSPSSGKWGRRRRWDDTFLLQVRVEM